MFGFAACGDDENAGPDAAPVDAGGVDAEPCSGHGCAGVDSPFQLPEGGEVRIEHFQLGPNSPVGGDLTAFQAFVFKNQTPLAREGFGPTIEHDVPGVECSDFSAGIYFDNGYSAEAEMIAKSRTYIDVGSKVTITSATGTEIVATKQAPGEVDLSASLPHEILYLGDASLTPEFNTAYTFAVEGTPEVPGLDLAFGETPFGEDRNDAAPTLFFPRQFTLTEPTDEAFFAGTNFTAGEDKTFTWTDEGELDASWPTVATFIVFVNETQQAVAGCTVVPAGNTITLPAEVLEKVPAEGTLLIGNFTHVAYEERQSANRVDLLGINCKLSSYTTTAATAAQ